MKRGILALCLAASLFAGLGRAQQGVLSANDSLDLLQSTAELMESIAITVPGLTRAAAPLVENARQTVSGIQGGLSPQSTELHYSALSAVSAFFALYDAMPKPDPYPEAGIQQVAKLRDNRLVLERNFRLLLARAESQLRGSDRDNLNRYKDANATVGAPQSGKPRVVFLGDSITDGWRLNEYFPDQDYINRGISGQITGQMLGRMLDDVLKHKPAAMVLLAGTNDIARGVPVSTIQSNITMITELAQKHGIKVILASILPIHDYNKNKDPRNMRSTARPMATIQQLNSWLAGYAKQNRATYLDYYSALVDSNGYLKEDLADDGLHPNGAGYRIMAPLAQAAISQALKSK